MYGRVHKRNNGVIEMTNGGDLALPSSEQKHFPVRNRKYYEMNVVRNLFIARKWITT